MCKPKAYHPCGGFRTGGRHALEELYLCFFLGGGGFSGSFFLSSESFYISYIYIYVDV